MQQINYFAHNRKKEHGVDGCWCGYKEKVVVHLSNFPIRIVSHQLTSQQLAVPFFRLQTDGHYTINRDGNLLYEENVAASLFQSHTLVFSICLLFFLL